MEDLLNVQNVIFVLGGLGIALKLYLKFRPQDREKLETAAQGIDMVDSVTDALLDTFPDNSALQTVDDIVDKLQKQFEKAGIDVNKGELKEKVKDKIDKTEGFSMNYDPESETTKLEYNKKF